jgi:predicted dienelactone hydrolase
MKVLRIVLVLIILLTAFVGVAMVVTRPTPLPESTETAARLEAGPFEVALDEVVWVDSSRPTDPNGDYAGAPDRTFKVAIWSPLGAPGPHPLVLYNHGFMSTRHGGTHLAEHLASHGYVVLAADYPLTNFEAPGGPNANDVLHQPADVSFLIDRALSLGPDERRFAGGIARDKIGVMGTSLGGLTSTLAAYHPRLADPRIRVAISIAGPSVLFSEEFFSFAEVPFLMIGGTHDAMIPFDENAAPIPDKISEGGLLAIEGASHAGFSYLASGPLRVLGNPDGIGCASLMENLDIEPGDDPFPGLGRPEDGVVDAKDAGLPCGIEFDDAMSAGRQQWLATVAAHAFFESHFAPDAAERSAHATFLETTFPEEITEVRYSRAKREALPPTRG